MATIVSVLFFWPLYCLSFSFGHYIVCPSFGHCIVCPFLVATILSVLFFWPLYCLSFSFGHYIVCPSIYGFWLSLWYVQTCLSNSAPQYTQNRCQFSGLSLFTEYKKLFDLKLLHCLVVYMIRKTNSCCTEQYNSYYVKVESIQVKDHQLYCSFQLAVCSLLYVKLKMVLYILIRFCPKKKGH